MIKFFRNIRKTLLTEGKTVSYLKYAFGEIFLVVLGILIALQINNWNEERKASNAENEALVALKNEFEKNIQNLKWIYERRENTQTGLRAYYELITNDTIPSEIKAKTERIGGFGGRWSVKNTVLEGLVNSGAIDNIKNDSLKTLLTNWPNLVNRYNDEEGRWRNLRDKLSDYLATRIGSPIPDSDGQWGYYPNNTESQLESQRASFVNELQYQNFVAGDITFLHILSLHSGWLVEDYDKIMKHLDIEIKNKKRD